jgi:hypothetical protein
LNYSDGAAATLEIKYGVHVGGWTAARHKTERPLQSPDTREVWQTQHSTMAATDLYLRLFHAALTNPSPDKEVRSLSLESAMADGSLMIAGISVGPAVAERLPDTVSSPKHPFPDLRPRRGDPAPVEGLVKSTRGQPLAKARVRVAAVRDLNTSDEESITEGPAVGTEVVTDLNGRFLFPALRDNQLYRLQVTADGFELAFFRGADPKADPIEIRLTPLPKP